MDGIVLAFAVLLIVGGVIMLIFQGSKDISKAVSNSRNLKQKEQWYYAEIDKKRSEYDRLYNEYLANEKKELINYLKEENLKKHCLIYESKSTAFGCTRKECCYVALSADEESLIIIQQYGPNSPYYSSDTYTINAPCPAQFVIERRWSMNSLLYFKMDGNIQYTANVRGGGVNLKGAVAGAVIAGGAGAVIGSRNAVSTETIKHDSREFIVAFEDGHEFCTSDNALKHYNAFMNIIPQKEISVYMQSVMSDSSSEIIDSNELVKLKELLDQGIITQEEFDAKKKQILGL